MALCARPFLEARLDGSLRPKIFAVTPGFVMMNYTRLLQGAVLTDTSSQEHWGDVFTDQDCWRNSRYCSSNSKHQPSIWI